MGMRLHTASTYKVKYADKPLGGYEISNDIIDMIRHSSTGWVSEDELEMEIDKDELENFLHTEKYSNLKELIERILQESDPDLYYIHLSIF